MTTRRDHTPLPPSPGGRNDNREPSRGGAHEVGKFGCKYIIPSTDAHPRPDEVDFKGGLTNEDIEGDLENASGALLRLLQEGDVQVRRIAYDVVTKKAFAFSAHSHKL